MVETTPCGTISLQSINSNCQKISKTSVSRLKKIKKLEKVHVKKVHPGDYNDMLPQQLEKTTHVSQWGRANLLFIIYNDIEVPGTMKIPHRVVKFEAGEEQNREVGIIYFK